jgi:hypothetical protein
VPTRPYSSYGRFEGDALVTPGEYTVTVEASGKKLSAQLEVLNDPHTAGTIQDIQAETRFLLEVRGELSQMANMINNLELVRLRNQAVEETLRLKSNAKLLKAAEDFGAKAADVEGNFIDMKLTGRSEDSFRNPMRLYGRLRYLADQVNLSPWGGNGSNLPPTQSVLAVHKVLQQRLAEYTQAYHQFMTTTLATYNAMLKADGLSVSLPSGSAETSKGR